MSDPVEESGGKIRRGRPRGYTEPIPNDEHGRNLLRLEMIRRGVGVRQLAAATGLSKATVSRAANGDSIRTDYKVLLSEAIQSFPVDAQADALLHGRFAESLPAAEEDS